MTRRPCSGCRPAGRRTVPLVGCPVVRRRLRGERWASACRRSSKLSDFDPKEDDGTSDGSPPQRTILCICLGSGCGLQRRISLSLDEDLSRNFRLVRAPGLAHNASMGMSMTPRGGSREADCEQGPSSVSPPSARRSSLPPPSVGPSSAPPSSVAPGSMRWESRERAMVDSRQSNWSRSTWRSGTAEHVLPEPRVLAARRIDHTNE